MRYKITFFLKVFLRLAIVSCLALIISYPIPAQADVIYQAFNMPFQEVKAQLPQLQGYTYIQVSPPEKSNPSDQWWGRYQPIDFTVLESPLGNENDLKELIDAAHEQNLKILVDVILNHMADYPPYSETLQYPRYSPQDFHPRTCINNDQDRYQVTHGWLGCSLPDLNTESPYVRQEAKNYLTHLLDLGVDGFRIDALKHIESQYFEEVLAVVPSDKYMYGEVLSGNLDDSYIYTGIHDLDVSDYALLGTLKNAFSFGGDLRSLIDPASFGGALTGSEAVTFAKTHDTVEGGDLYNYYGFNPQDQMLANAYILARSEGIPLIYRDDTSNPIAQAGINFHEQLIDQPQYFRNGNEIAEGADSPNLLFIERGDRGLAIINKAGESFEQTSARMPGLEVGCYQELQSNLTMCVSQENDGQKYITQWGSSEQGGLQVDGRTALFFVKNEG
ncbi:MAG: alpha-amylase family protein [Xenococcaceae cyanobacterium MO_188.B29]|nr:alpha-amylase family protein [Xenococcaceae cyanobacterium MO_188.B29]